MDNIEIIIERLTKLGVFTDYEIRVYIKLLEKKFYTASQLAIASGVPRTKTYEVINSLVNKGLAQEIACPVKKFSAVEPEIALDNIKLRIASETSEKYVAIDSVISELKSLFSTQVHDEIDSEYIQIYKGRTTIWQKLQEQSLLAKKELLVFSKEPYLITVGKNRNAYSKLKDSVSLKTVYEIPEDIDDKFLKGLKDFKESGEEIRLFKKLPLKLTVIDQEIVFIITYTPSEHNDGLTAYIINQKDIVNSYIALFNHFWDISQTYNQFIKSNSLL